MRLKEITMRVSSMSKFGALFFVSSSAFAFDIPTPIEEIPGRRVLLENSGRKYASCFGRDYDVRVRSELEVAEIVVRGSYLESLLDDGIIYGLAVRGYIGHSGEVTVGLDPLVDAASLDAEYDVNVTIEFAGRVFSTPVVPQLFCTTETDEGVVSSTARGAFLMEDAGIVSCSSSDVFFTITTLDSLLQALDFAPGTTPDMKVTVSAAFEGTYACSGSHHSLSIGRAEIMTPWLTVFNLSEAVCY